MNTLLLFKIIIYLSDVYLTSSENETLALNDTAIQKIMASKISVNRSQLDEGKVINYLYGDSDVNDYEQHLDIFEPEEVKQLVETAYSKSELIEREFNKSRRWYYTPGFIPGTYFITKSLDFVRQSIYGTRYRLKDTKYLRRHFAGDTAFQIAVLYGSLMQLRIKMDNIYATLYKFDKDIKFLWYIVLYERCIATTVDANYMVQRMFALSQKHAEDQADERDNNKLGKTGPS